MRFVPPLDKHDYDQEVLIPLREAQREKKEKDRVACEDKGGHIENDACVMPPPPVVVAPAPVQAQGSYAGYSKTISVSEVVSGTLTGLLGYSLAWGNCVNEPGVNNPRNGANPIGWPITSTTPWIGASALFYFNHVAVVTGIWSNGDIEVRQQNSPGAPHRYPASMIRGYR